MPENSSSTSSTLSVSVLDVKNVDTSSPLYVEFKVGDQKELKVRVKPKGAPSEPQVDGIIVSVKKLSELYDKILTFTLKSETTNATLGSGSIPINRFMIGRKVDRFFDLPPASPERATQQTPPSLRLTVEVNGPLRAEFAFLKGVVTRYGSTIDRGLDVAYTTRMEPAAVPGGAVKPYVYWLFIPTSLVVLGSLPLVAITVTIGLPIFLPLIILGLIGAAIALSAAVVIGLSSRAGRAAIQRATDPIVFKLTQTAVGQQLMYETGPRPSPVRVAKTFCPSNMWNKLIFSIILDAIGSSSYVVPGLGEFTDVAWAPTQAVLMAAMYSESSPYAAYVGMLEEILPFTDIIPSVTLAWLRENAGEVVKSLHLTVQQTQQFQQQQQSRPYQPQVPPQVPQPQAVRTR